MQQELYKALIEKLGNAIQLGNTTRFLKNVL